MRARDIKWGALDLVISVSGEPCIHVFKESSTPSLLFIKPVFPHGREKFWGGSVNFSDSDEKKQDLKISKEPELIIYGTKPLLSYYLPTSSEVSFNIYNILGQNVLTLNEGKRDEGWHKLIITNLHLQSGIYFIRFQTRSQSITKKFMILKR